MKVINCNFDLVFCFGQVTNACVCVYAVDLCVCVYVCVDLCVCVCAFQSQALWLVVVPPRERELREGPTYLLH